MVAQGSKVDYLSEESMESHSHRLDRRDSPSKQQTKPPLHNMNPDEFPKQSSQYTVTASESDARTRRRGSCGSHIDTRYKCRMLFTSAAVLILYSSVMLPATAATQTTSAFVFPPNISSTSRPDNSMSILSRKAPMRRTNFSSYLPPTTTSQRSDTWSNAVRQKSGLNESRFGVRRRVRSVLDKAKKRTGIDNSSAEKDEDPYVQTGLNVVAEAASIGGWGTVTTDEQGHVDEEADLGRGDSFYEDVVSFESVLSSDDLIAAERERNGAAQHIGSPIREKDDSIPAPISSNGSESSAVVVESVSLEKEAFADKIETQMASFEPLPFTTPKLSPEQYSRLMRGERVQFQDDMGRAGSGFVVWDVKAPSSVVWDCLLDFQSYPQTIPTVREVTMYTNTQIKKDYRAEKPLDFEDGTAAICKHGIPSVTRAQFALSKFRLKIAAIHKYQPNAKGDYMIFTLDPTSRNMVLKYAKGIWHTQSNPDGKEGYTRVWLLCELSVSRLLPQWIVDYAAARAMPRATTWLKPQVEAAATLWLKDAAKN